MTEEDFVKTLKCCAEDNCDDCSIDFGNCYSNLARETLSIYDKQQSQILELSKQLEQLELEYEQAISKCRTLYRVAESIMHDSFSYQVDELRGAVVDAVKSGEEYSKKLIETFNNQISEDFK